MGFQIIKAYKEHFPALRLIGKRYTNADRDAGGGYGDKWHEWHQNGWLAEMEKLGPTFANRHSTRMASSGRRSIVLPSSR